MLAHVGTRSRSHLLVLGRYKVVVGVDVDVMMRRARGGGGGGGGHRDAAGTRRWWW